VNAVTVNDAKQNLEQLIERVIADAEPAIICTDKGERVVLLSLEEFNSWRETLYLLSSPANADHLRKSLEEARSALTVEKELIEA
jgi:antitoxin YefM